DLPGPRERLRIGNRRFVAEDVRRRARVALGDLQLIAVEVAGPIEPGAVVEAGRLDDERLALPVADRLAHPRIDGRWTRILEVDVSHRARVLIREEDGARALQDLERLRHVVRARHAWQVALDLGVALQPLLLVFFF